MTVGVSRLVHDLQESGYPNAYPAKGSDNMDYAVIPGYQIPAGSFAGRVIDLAIPAPTDFPRSLGASIHIKATPQLAEKGQIVNLRNVTDSSLGIEWRYWSFRFHVRPSNPTDELLTQINEIFRKN
jgi:hypothetical protein